MSDPANVWPSLFERRRIVLGASMVTLNGLMQKEGEVVTVNGKIVASVGVNAKIAWKVLPRLFPPCSADHSLQSPRASGLLSNGKENRAWTNRRVLHFEV